MYGYLDESGTPGVADNDNDFLAVSLVIFQNKEIVEKCTKSITHLRKRLKLPEEYEFHRSHNSRTIQTAFIQLISEMDFRFITIVIKKNGSRLHASYPKIAQLLVQEITKNYSESKIEMDTNPILYVHLRRNVRKTKLSKIKFKETKSHNNNLIQLADYVVALSVAKAKNLGKSAENYRKISKKQQTYKEL